MTKNNITKDKKIAQRIHAKRRAEQRFGLTLNRRDMRQIVLNIQSRNPELAQFVSRTSNRVTLWRIYWDGGWYKVVYDTNRGTLVSFLPESDITSNE